MVTAVDANVLLRWLVHDDETLSKKAEAIITSAKPGALEVDRLIVAEITYVLRSYYEIPKARIVDNLRTMLDTEVFSFADRDLVTAAINIFANEQPLSFEDSWLLALKRTGKVRHIATFDKNLDKRQ